MTSNKIIPAHILRNYIWELLKLNTGMQEVNNMIPVVPIEDEPKLADSGKSYIVYGYADSESRGPDQIRRGVFSARIVAPTFGELVEISNTISSAFESRDVATEGVNLWSSAFNLDGTNPFLGIRFTELVTSHTESAQPPETEGGVVDAVVNIAYRFISNTEIIYPVSGGLWNDVRPTT